MLSDQIRVFTEAGYTVSAKVLNAAEYGVAQERKRIFIVGIRNDFKVKYEFPQPTHGPATGVNYVTIKDAIGHLPEWPEGEFYDMGFHWYYMSRNRRQDWDQISKTIVANARHMPLHPVSPPMEKVRTDEWRFVEDRRARRFSFREAALLQGFEDLVFPETNAASLGMKYTVVGNAVPPPLLKL